MWIVIDETSNFKQAAVLSQRVRIVGVRVWTIATHRRNIYSDDIKLNVKRYVDSPIGEIARRDIANEKDNQVRSFLRGSTAKSLDCLTLSPYRMAQRPRGFLQPPCPSFYLSSFPSPSHFLCSSSLSYSFPASLTRFDHMAHMHACMHASTVPACMHASRSEDGSTRGSDWGLSLSLSSFLRLAEERRTTAR